MVWFRRDLRMADHPALAAARQSEHVVPVFCFDPRLLVAVTRRARARSSCWRACDDLERRCVTGAVGSSCAAATRDEIAVLAEETGAAAVHATSDVGPLARRREQRVNEALSAIDARLHCSRDSSPRTIRPDIVTGAGDAYRVFSPYHRAWLHAPAIAAGAPSSCRACPPMCASGSSPRSTNSASIRRWATRLPAARIRPCPDGGVPARAGARLRVATMTCSPKLAPQRCRLTCTSAACRPASWNCVSPAAPTPRRTGGSCAGETSTPS